VLLNHATSVRFRADISITDSGGQKQLTLELGLFAVFMTARQLSGIMFYFVLLTRVSAEERLLTVSLKCKPQFAGTRSKCIRLRASHLRCTRNI